MKKQMTEKSKNYEEIQKSPFNKGAGARSATGGSLKEYRGITLIALIITIIVMLILVSVTISMAINGGLFEYAGKSVSDTENAINAEQQLANGEIKIGDTWYNSMDDYLAGVESVKSLQAKHEFKYYSSLGKAVTDVNNNTRENADTDKENAVAGIYAENGKHTVVLLKDAIEEARVEPKVDMTINLGGHTLSTEDVLAIKCISGEITIDGRLKESKIEVKHTGGKAARAIQVNSGSNLNINGGTFVVNTEGYEGTTACIYLNDNVIANISDATIIGTETSGILTGFRISATTTNISNCTINVTAENGIVHGIDPAKGTTTINNCNITATTYDGETGGILNYNNSTAIINDCNITATTTNGNSFGIGNNGIATVTNCDIRTYSNYMYGDEDYYAALSQGVRNEGTLTINDCYAMGTHSGLQNEGEGTLYVNGGIYEGYGHGGFYFSGGGSGNTAYVRNATIRECAMPDGYTATAGDNHAGCYIGGSSTSNNIKVYMDNCDIYGSSQPIVLRGSSGEQNNSLYISNSRINTDKKIRIDNDTHKLYIGTGNNFTADNTNRPSAVVETEEVYIQN